MNSRRGFFKKLGIGFLSIGSVRTLLPELSKEEGKDEGLSQYEETWEGIKFSGIKLGTVLPAFSDADCQPGCRCVNGYCESVGCVDPECIELISVAEMAIRAMFDFEFTLSNKSNLKLGDVIGFLGSDLRFEIRVFNPIDRNEIPVSQRIFVRQMQPTELQDLIPFLGRAIFKINKKSST